MGIRMLNHRPAASRTAVGAAPAVPAPPVPAVAAGASTARVPAGLTAILRRTTTGLRGRFVPGEPLPWRLWADLTRGYVALLLARLPHPAPAHTVTVFVAAPIGLTDRPAGPLPRRPRPDGHPRHDGPSPRDRRPREERPNGHNRPRRRD